MGFLDNTGLTEVWAKIKNLADTKINKTLIGSAGGVASLDSSGKVPSSQLPSYVDDVVEYAGKSNFPSAGETGKIYVDTSTNKTYRWGGSNYTEISASIALGETSSTAYRGDRGKVAYDHSQIAHAPSNAQANQNAFSSVMINSTSIVANTPTDTLTLVAGSNITLTPDAANDKVTIAAKGTTYSNATTSAAGLMSAADKSKLDGIATGANKYSYTLPTASSSTLGGVKTGSNITNTSGVISVTKENVISALGYTPPSTNITYSAISSSEIDSICT